MTSARLSTAVIAIAGLVGCSSDALLGVLGGAGGSGSGGQTSETSGTVGSDDASGDGSSGAGSNPTIGSWSVISQNTLSDVDPCPEFPCSWSGAAGQEGVLSRWNGGAFAADLGAQGRLIAWGGGGSSGYYGNELYVFDIADGLWIRITDPVANPDVTMPDFGELQDGSPVVFQTNDLLEYHPPTRSFVALAGSSTLAGAKSGTGHMFDFEALAWRRAATTLLSSGLGSSAYDPSREVIWGHSQFGRLYRFAPVAGPDAEGRHGEVEVYDEIITVQIYTVAAIEERHDLYVLWDAGAGTVQVVDLKAPNLGPTTLVTEGVAPTVSGGGFEWVAERAQFFWYAGSGNDIRTLTAPAAGSDWAVEPWRWEPVEVSGGVPPEPRQTPIFGSWRWAPAIQSFVICNGNEAPVRAFKI